KWRQRRTGRGRVQHAGGPYQQRECQQHGQAEQPEPAAPPSERLAAPERRARRQPRAPRILSSVVLRRPKVQAPRKPRKLHYGHGNLRAATGPPRRRSSASVRSAAQSQVLRAATSRPLAASSAASDWSVSTRSSACDQDRTSRAGTTSEAPPPASTTAGASLVTVGTPAAIASRTGSPNPSTSDGNANAAAPR